MASASGFAPAPPAFAAVKLRKLLPVRASEPPPPKPARFSFISRKKPLNREAFVFAREALRQRDNVNLNQHILRKTRHFDRRPGRGRRGEELAIHRVHRREVVHVFEEDAALYYLLHAGARRFQDGRQVLHDSLRLLGNTAGHDLTRGRIDGHLPGNEDESSGLDGLRIRPNRLRPLLGGDHFSHALPPGSRLQKKNCLIRVLASSSTLPLLYFWGNGRRS